MNYEIPEKMKAWVLGDPGELTLEEKPVPEPKRAEVLIHVDAVAICATDLEIIKNGVNSNLWLFFVWVFSVSPLDIWENFIRDLLRDMNIWELL